MKKSSNAIVSNIFSPPPSRTTFISIHKIYFSILKRGMGKRQNSNGPTTLPIDHYRRQLGKQENKVTKRQAKQVLQKKADQETVNKFNSYLIALAVCLLCLIIAYLTIRVVYH